MSSRKPGQGKEGEEPEERTGLLQAEEEGSDSGSEMEEGDEGNRMAGRDGGARTSTTSKGGETVKVSDASASKEKPEESASRSAETVSAEKDFHPALCRICLEEDTLDNLEVPCACTGTQQHAHHDCIQKWVAEKGHLRCEICHQDYTVEYDVPPPPPAPPQPVFQPMYIVDGDGMARTVVSNGTHVVEVMDDYDPRVRNPGAQWGMSLMLFFMFMVLLHPGDPDEGEYDWPPAPPPSPPMYAPGQDPYADSVQLFLLAVLIKILFVAIPMMMVLKIAARGAQQQQYELMLRQSAYDASISSQMRQLRGSRYDSVYGPNAV